MRRPSALHLILFPLSVVMVTPLVWMLLVSVSTREESRRFPPGLPSGIEWENYLYHEGPICDELGLPRRIFYTNLTSLFGQTLIGGGTLIA
jgi:ABC-type glycerol-3-phosphate transport system permease component